MSGIVGKNAGRDSGIVGTTPVTADSITGDEIADDAIDSEHYTDGSIDNAHIADDAIDSEHYADGSIDLAHMSSESVDEDNLHISNSGSNGNFLSKQSGDAGGLTWAAAGGGGFETGSSAYLGSAQTITTATVTKLTFGTERYDLGSDFDSSTNYRFVPPVTGEYLITAKVKGAPGDGKRIDLSIFVAGSNTRDTRLNGSSANAYAAHVTGILQLTATDDYVEIFVYHDKGSNMDVSGSSSIESTFDIHRLS